MKVLFVVPDLAKNHGGPSDSVPRTAQAMAEAGCTAGIVFCNPDDISDSARRASAAGVRLHPMPAVPRFLNPAWVSMAFARRFEPIASGYDMLVINVCWMFPVWWAAHVARKLGKPYVIMPRGSFNVARLKVSAWKKRMVGLIDRYSARRADALWVTAQAEAFDAEAYLPGIKTEVFPIGIDVANYVVQSEKPNGNRILLYMSRISPIKGLDMLAEAWERASPRGWKLVIAGPDDRGYEDEVKRIFAEKCPDGEYEFVPPVFGAEKIRLLREASAFVLPTRNENWGIVVAEAMASGLPVICTKGAPWECLTETDSGWWTEISADALVAAIEEMSSMSSSELCAKGQRGRKWVEENLDWGKIGAAMLKSAGKIVARKLEKI